jgi:hypothetical protein
MGKNKKKKAVAAEAETNTHKNDDIGSSDSRSRPLASLVSLGSAPSPLSSLPKKKRVRPPVQVFDCPNAFPEEKKEDSKRYEGRRERKDSMEEKEIVMLDFHKAAEEVRTLGSTGLQRPEKRKRREEMYKQMTGMKPKGQKMPAKLFMELQRQRATKEKRLDEEARESGLVTISDNDRKRRKDEKERKTFREKRKQIGAHGPSPDIGFMTNGMYKVKKT